MRKRETETVQLLETYNKTSSQACWDLDDRNIGKSWNLKISFMIKLFEVKHWNVGRNLIEKLNCLGQQGSSRPDFIIWKMIAHFASLS